LDHILTSLATNEGQGSNAAGYVTASEVWYPDAVYYARPAEAMIGVRFFGTITTGRRFLERLGRFPLSPDYFGLSETQLTKKRGHHRPQRALVMELLRRYSGLKQRMIGRFGDLDEGLVSRDRRAIRKRSRRNRRSESGFWISRS
jgi:hypothetical protein